MHTRDLFSKSMDIGISLYLEEIYSRKRNPGTSFDMGSTDVTVSVNYGLTEYSSPNILLSLTKFKFF